MCDTIVALPKYTSDGKMLFAKNSDRSPNEPQFLQRIKASDYDLQKNPNLKLTYIIIPQVEHTYEVVLSRPSWMWGAEFGFNEFGLIIGNEAVFTKEKYIKDKGITGMDMLRLALERTKTAKDALNFMIDLLKEYNQGGNCGYDKKFYYHNSFIIADCNEAYVFETAGKYWVWKKVESFYAISNCLSLETYDACHPELISHAVDMGWCESEKDFNFVDCYTEPIYTKFSKSRIRRNKATELLRIGKHNEKSFMTILRNHGGKANIDHAEVGSICMHAGGLVGDHTTASIVAKIGGDINEYYVTGSSMPCLSIFKPLILQDKMPIAEFGEDKKGINYWKTREKLFRYFISGTLNEKSFLVEKEAFENLIHDEFDKALINEKGDIMLNAFKSENELIEKYLKKAKGKKLLFKRGSFIYKNFWKIKTRSLFK